MDLSSLGSLPNYFLLFGVVRMAVQITLYLQWVDIGEPFEGPLERYTRQRDVWNIHKEALITDGDDVLTESDVAYLSRFKHLATCSNDYPKRMSSSGSKAIAACMRVRRMPYG